MQKIGQIADQADPPLPIYVVGGFVRDTLLQRDNDDIDLVVEGDGIMFADLLGKKMGKKVQHYPQFATAVVTLESGLKIDVATARLVTLFFFY